MVARGRFRTKQVQETYFENRFRKKKDYVKLKTGPVIDSVNVEFVICFVLSIKRRIYILRRHMQLRRFICIIHFSTLLSFSLMCTHWNLRQQDMAFSCDAIVAERVHLTQVKKLCKYKKS